MPGSNLKTKLSELERHVDEAEARLRLKGMFSADHQATAAELKQRYALLSHRVQDDVTEAERHGHHVGDLEASVRQWLDSLEIDLD